MIIQKGRGFLEENNEILNKMKELFITVRYKYIKQNIDGNGYQTFNQYEKERHKPLHDGFLKSHLMRENTYGIFCRKNLTKFVTFDVDVPDKTEAKRVVLALYESLSNLGIPTDKIYTSWSGTKGYHVDIYFSKEIPYKYMEKLYDAAVKSTLNLLGGNIEGQIEKRPSPTQGLKLPLSINFKNKNQVDNICWYVDVQENFMPIRSLDFILSIEPIDAQVISDLINDLPDVEIDQSLSKGKLLEENSVNADFSNFDLSKENLNTLEKLYNEGLKKSGTRNAALCKLAIYFNTLKVQKSECYLLLKDWMDNQNPILYKTPIKTCYQEINRIVDLVYKKNVILFKSKTEISISRSEMLTIYQYPKKLHNIITVLLIHSKRFEDKDKKFYMTYEQISRASRCAVRTAMNQIKELEKNGIIKVTRGRILGTHENYPNTYELNMNWLKSDKEIMVNVSAETLESYLDIRIYLITEIFSYIELSNIKEILIKTKEQQAITIQ